MSSSDEAARLQSAVIREAAHAAVAEHFGFRVAAVHIDWRGFAVCRYEGDFNPCANPFRVNLVVLLAGLVGERVVRRQPCISDDQDITGWMESDVEFDPDDDPDTGFHPDLVLALQALGGDLAKLNDCEREAHQLLCTVPEVTAHWHALRRTLSTLQQGAQVG